MQAFFEIKARLMQKIVKILSVLVGLFLLVSAYAKAADAAYFSNLLTHYGQEWLGWFAPVIIAAELILGLLLFLQLKVRYAAWATVGFMGIITLGFAYGVAFHGVYNCGCFGHLEFLNLPPAWTFVRNIILCGILLFIGIKWSDASGHSEACDTITSNFSEACDTLTSCNFWKRTLLVLGLAIGMFTVGLTFTKSSVMIKSNRSVVPRLLSETAIPRYVTDISPDSTYLVFVFSYNCPYCNQSIGNVAMFEHTHTVDRVIGLALEDSIAEQSFREFYHELPFEVRPMPVEAILDITNDHLPTTFLIRHDTIFVTTRSEMFSPRFVNGFNPNK